MPFSKEIVHYFSGYMYVKVKLLPVLKNIEIIRFRVKQYRVNIKSRFSIKVCYLLHTFEELHAFRPTLYNLENISIILGLRQVPNLPVSVPDVSSGATFFTLREWKHFAGIENSCIHSRQYFFISTEICICFSNGPHFDGNSNTLYFYYLTALFGLCFIYWRRSRSS